MEALHTPHMNSMVSKVPCTWRSLRPSGDSQAIRASSLTAGDLVHGSTIAANNVLGVISEDHFEGPLH